MNIPDQFRALVLEEADGTVRAGVRELDRSQLPQRDVLVGVEFSSLNYKDGLAITGRGKVVRSYPMVPGVDLAGTVLESASPDYRPGDRVLVNGWGVGERHWGGMSSLAAVDADWLLPLPEGLSTRQAMDIGTAGYTAMLALMALEEHGLTPGAGDIAVSGASGGVGSMAVALLAARGYRAVASTGREELGEYLRGLGAAAVVGRDDLAAPASRPLASARWAGAIDSVGGRTLAGLLSATAPHASIAACGNAAGNELATTVLPFILRGVNLLGIDSNNCPVPRRREAWERLAREFPLDRLNEITRVATLADVPQLAEEILAGRIRGRVTIDTREH